jgi:hypothetical protein
MEPGALLRAARTRRGLTQAALAASAGTSQPVISAYEHGRRDPTTGTLERLIAAAGERLELRLSSTPPAIPPAASKAEHAARLLDVLLLADAIPTARRPGATMPRLVSTR